MKKTKVNTLDADLAGGINTTAQEDGLPYPALVDLQNARLSRTGLMRRPGMRRTCRAASETATYDLNGTTQYATILNDTRTNDLKRRWTLEGLVQADSFAANAKTIFGVAHAADYGVKVYFTTAGLLEAKVQDSAGTVTTLTSATTFAIATRYAWQVVRDGTSLTLKVNGTTEDSDTVADLDCKSPGGSLYIGRDNAGLYFDGIIDFVRLFTTAKADQTYGKIRLVLPRSEDVLFDYVMQSALTGGGTYVHDRSRFENHASVSGSPSTIASLAAQTVPVTGFFTWPDENAQHRSALFAGRQLYLQNLVR